MELWEIEARLGIEDTVARYVRFADSGRGAELGGLFVDDGVLATNAEEASGRRAIVTYLEATRANLAASATGGGRIRHHVSSLRIDLLGRDEARATCYFLAVTAVGPDHWGTYRDRLVRTGSGWRFTERIATVEGTAPGSWAADRLRGSG
jgi:hypothetical protein